MEISILLLWLPVASLAILHDIEDLRQPFEQRRNVRLKKHKPYYHIAAPEGWLTGPSGFVYFKKRYHIFYQYHSKSGVWGHIQWGHAVSKNLADWKHYPPAVAPKEYYDRHGCSSGSTQIHENYLYLFYTGNVMFSNQVFQTQNVAISSDAVMFQKYLYNPIIKVPPPGVKEFKNPKVWKFREMWYMLIASMSNENNGQLLLYSSSDLFNWKFNSTLAESFGDMGYLWENPELFEIMDHHVLIFSAQGVQSDGHRYRNLYQTGYVIGKFNYVHAQFDDLEISTATFNELDYGHDFYAAKTMLAPDGRILLIAWLGMWDSEFAELSSGWAGMLTSVREVKINNRGRILMTPVAETVSLRSDTLEEAWYNPGEAFLADVKAFELLVNTTAVFSDVGLSLEWDGGRYRIGYLSEIGQVSVDRGGEDGIRKADWLPEHHVYFHIFVDSSSIEVFCGHGEVVFSSRIYPKAIQIKIEGTTAVYISQFRLRRSISIDKDLARSLKSQGQVEFGLSML